MDFPLDPLLVASLTSIHPAPSLFRACRQGVIIDNWVEDEVASRNIGANFIGRDAMPMPTASTQMDAFTAAVRPPPAVPPFVGSPREFVRSPLRRRSSLRAPPSILPPLSPRRSRAAPSSRARTSRETDQGKTGAGIVPPRMDRQAPPLVPLEHKFSHGLGDVANDAFYDLTTSDLAFGDPSSGGWGKKTVTSGLWTGRKANDFLCPTVGARRAKSDAKKAAAAAEMAGFDRYVATSKSATEATVALGMPERVVGVPPSSASEGGQPAQCGRKAVGGFCREFDRPYHKIGLRR
jgi:hypothetical protein